MIKKWRSQGDMTFLVGGAEYNDGHIVVPTDGYYFVYWWDTKLIFVSSSFLVDQEYIVGKISVVRRNLYSSVRNTFLPPILSLYFVLFCASYARQGKIDLLYKNETMRYMYLVEIKQWDTCI